MKRSNYHPIFMLWNLFLFGRISIEQAVNRKPRSSAGCGEASKWCLLPTSQKECMFWSNYVLVSCPRSFVEELVVTQAWGARQCRRQDVRQLTSPDHLLHCNEYHALVKALTGKCDWNGDQCWSTELPCLDLFAEDSGMVRLFAYRKQVSAPNQYFWPGLS